MASRLGPAVLLLIAGAGAGILTVMAPDVAAAILVLQLPGALILLFDATPGRAVGRTIVGIWFQCEGLRQCVAMATGARTMLILLLCVALAFLLTQALPILLKLLD